MNELFKDNYGFFFLWNKKIVTPNLNTTEN